MKKLILDNIEHVDPISVSLLIERAGDCTSYSVALLAKHVQSHEGYEPHILVRERSGNYLWYWRPLVGCNQVLTNGAATPKDALDGLKVMKKSGQFLKDYEVFLLEDDEDLKQFVRIMDNLNT